MKECYLFSNPVPVDALVIRLEDVGCLRIGVQ